MKILITGGKGYLGSHIAEFFGKEDLEFFIADFDITKFEEVDQAFATSKLDIVIHLAALSGIALCEEEASLCHKVNVLGTENILKAMLKNNVHNIIFASSSAVYSESDSLLQEDHALAPNNEYGKSKLAAEKLITEYQKLGINSVIFRIFNLAGFDLNSEYKKLYYNKPYLIPTLIRCALNNQIFTMLGNDYDTADKTAIRDYIHVSDAAKAFFLACGYLNENRESNIFNIGSSTPTSVKQVYDLVEKHINKDIPTSVSTRHPIDKKYIVADTSKAQRILSWLPKSSNIDNIIWSSIESSFKKNTAN